jgi:hypothetical protein
MGKWRYTYRILELDSIDGGRWLASRPDRLTPRGKNPQDPLDRKVRAVPVLN